MVWCWRTGGLRPKLLEAKYLFQPAFLTPDDTGVTIQNRRLFTSLDDLHLRWTVALNGVALDAGVATLPTILPGETAHVELPLTLPEDAGEVTLTCLLVTASDVPFLANRYTYRPAAPCATASLRGPTIVGVHMPKLIPCSAGPRRAWSPCATPPGRKCCSMPPS